MTPAAHAMPQAQAQVLRLGGGQLLLRGPAVLIVSQLAQLGARQWFQVGGVSISLPVRQLLDDLAAEASEYVRPEVRADVREQRPGASSGVMKAQRLTSAQAAEALGYSQRHVRRIAPSLSGVRVGATWTFDAAEVAAYRMERDSQ